jgi:hypothetical protein
MRFRCVFVAGVSAFLSWKLREHAIWVEGPDNAGQDGTCTGIEALISTFLSYVFASAVLISMWKGLQVWRSLRDAARTLLAK